ncbi:transporter [Streptomyces sp. NPDC018321]|uniref:transporter n=1 Tax=unclassified Streptomyces TaxID=2593676 RepID=UPI00378C38A2
MVGLFVRLKLALLRGSLRRSGARAAGFVVGALAALAAAGLTAARLAQRHGEPAAADLAVLACAGLLVGWVVLPLTAGSGTGDESADPTRLAVLPLRPRPLIVGSTAAALVGPGPLVTLVVLAGATAAVTGTVAAVAVAVPAALLALLLCVVTSRAVTAAYARALTSRRGKDAAAMGGLLVAVVSFTAYLLLSSAGAPEPSVPPVVSDVLRRTPPGWVADAPHAATEGRWGVALAELGATALLILLLAGWWHHSLVRLMTTSDRSTARPARSRSADAGVWARLGSRSRTLLITHHQLRSFARAPRHRMLMVTSLAYSSIFPLVLVAVAVKTPYAALGGAWVFALSSPSMLFTMDGSAVWTNVATTRSVAHARAEVTGRFLAQIVVAVPWLTAITVVIALATGTTGQIPEVLGLVCALLGVTFSMGAVISVRWPYAFEHDSILTGVPGQGGTYHLMNFAASIAGPLATVPLVAGAVLLHGTGHAWLLLPAGLAYGLLVTSVVLRRTGVRLFRTYPDVLNALRLG